MFSRPPLNLRSVGSGPGRARDRLHIRITIDYGAAVYLSTALAGRDAPRKGQTLPHLKFTLSFRDAKIPPVVCERAIVRGRCGH